ncbi:MAG: hypothetical protein QNJ54_31755 [Prochloraceae cyanobacterium]|nr:hypothetical protein [Prochloraceae cyanobacterium]
MFTQEKKLEQLSNAIIHCPSIVEDEEIGIIYLGCAAKEVRDYLSALFILYRCEDTYVNERPEHLLNFEREIVIPNIQALGDRNALGLNDLIESELEKHCQINFDSYNYYTSRSCAIRWLEIDSYPYRKRVRRISR